MEALLVLSANSQKMIKKIKIFFREYWLFLLIITLAAILRFYRFGQVPPGFTWDEAAIGYNGHAIVKTRRDEWLEFLPVSFQSFGDYKAPLAIYINGLFTFIFGLNKIAVRLPFALSGVIAVVGIYFLIKSSLEYLDYKGQLSLRSLGLMAALILAGSPWHLHFTRAGFETGLALTFIIWSLYLLLIFFKTAKQDKFNQKLLTLGGSATLALASIYTYHSAKIFVPLVFTIIVLAEIKKFWDSKRVSLVVLIWTLLLAYPLLADAVFGQGLERGKSLIFFLNLSLIDTIKLFFSNLGAHLSLDFLIRGETTTLRHTTGAYGVLLPVTLAFVIYSLVGAIVQKISIDRDKPLKMTVISLIWILIGLLPASLARGVPQANRALLALPGFILLAVLGLDYFLVFFRWLQSKLQVRAKHVLSLIFLIYLLNLGAYLHYYYQVFPQLAVHDFRDGYLQAFRYAHRYERGLDGYPEKRQIVFTDQYGQPYIYALFVRKTNPIWYQGGSLRKYLFVSDIDQSDLARENAVIIAGQDQLEDKQDQAEKIIYGADGQVRFRIFVTD